MIAPPASCLRGLIALRGSSPRSEWEPVTLRATNPEDIELSFAQILLCFADPRLREGMKTRRDVFTGCVKSAGLLALHQIGPVSWLWCQSAQHAGQASDA